MIKIKKTLVIGIDGASWDIVNFLIKEGRLPTISKLILKGVSGDLESSIPFLSSPAWKCLSTGKNPGKLGVYSFHYLGKDGEIKPANAKSFKSKELWDYLSYKGLSSCTVNIPMTFPPHPIKGVMISGIPAFTHLNYTYPSYIKDILSKDIDYDINPKKVFPEIKSVAKEIKKRFDAAKVLIHTYDEKFDFIQITVFCIDNIAPYFTSLSTGA